MSLKTKLLLAFAVVLAPVLVLLHLAFRETLNAEEESILDAQLLTAQAVGVQIDHAFDAAIGLGWAVAQDPIVRTMDPERLDGHLRKLAERSPRFDAINVFDANGVNRGWGHKVHSAEPRPGIADRAYFQQVMETNEAVISDVLELKRRPDYGFVVSVPVRDEAGRPMGVVNVVAAADLLARGYADARLRPGQAILLTDRKGQVAFNTLRPQLSYEAVQGYRKNEKLKRALGGETVLDPNFDSPLLGAERMGAMVPTPRHGWVVAVSIPRDVALEPSRQLYRRQLLAWAGILCFSLLLASLLVRYLGGPVKRLEAHARSIGAGQLDRRVEIRTGDELEQLGIAFNDMAERLALRERELRDAQAELVRRERLAAVGELAAVVAHEVRNPLGVIFNAVAGLRRNGTLPADAETLHAILQEEADRLDRIVGDLLDFARPLQPSLEPGDVTQLVREALANALSGAPDVDLHEHFEPDLPMLAVDARMIRQVLVNVAVNAVQAMPNGGRLELCGAREVRHGRDGVRIELRDQGIGIPVELQRRISEPFFTTKAKGTGLGLAVVRRIVQEHLGEFSIDSVEGQGTTVTIWLPAPDASRAAA
ncbi:MAG: ATP-binding protein [Myxococcaceae bacterium]